MYTYLKVVKVNVTWIFVAFLAVVLLNLSLKGLQGRFSPFLY